MDRNAFGRGLRAASLSVIVTLVVCESVHSEDRFSEVAAAIIEDLHSEDHKLDVDLLQLRNRLSRLPDNRKAKVGDAEGTPVVKIFNTAFVDIQKITSVLDGHPDVSVRALHGGERLAVVATADQMEIIAQAIEKLNQPRDQIRIASRMFEIPADDLDFDAGGAAGQVLHGSMFVRPIYQLDKLVWGGNLIRSSQDRDLETLSKAISRLDDARLLARSNIITYDNVAASFESVSEIVVKQTLTETEDGGRIGTTEFREVGIRLRVTPNIASDGEITLTVNPDFSVLVGFHDGQPIIDRRSCTTTAKVRDGELLVICGMRRRQEGPDGADPVETELLVLMKAEVRKSGHR